MTTLVNHTIGRHWPICNAETLSNYFNIVERPPKQALGRTIIFGLPTALLLAFVPGISVVGALLLGLIGWGVFFANDDTKCKHCLLYTSRCL